MTLSEVMHVHIPSLRLDSTFRDAVDKMDIYQFPALVVVDVDKKPVAVLTEGDLARAISQKGDVTGLGTAKAIDFATRHPAVAQPDLEVSEALHLMLTQGHTLLPIVSDGRLAGIVLRVDLMQALLMDVAAPLPPEAAG
jgi:CBS domain-containing protein